MKTIKLFLALIVFTGLSVNAQVSKKQAVEKKILSVEEWETDLRTRKPKAIQESFTKYDANGNLVEIIERDNVGEITLYEKYEYDASGNKTIETQLKADGQIKKKHIYSYENKLRVARKTYDKEGKLIAEKKYIYKFYDK